MALVMAYRIAFLPPGMTFAPDEPLPDGTVADIVLMTNRVLVDDTPIFARASEPELAIAEMDGDPVPMSETYWPSMGGATRGRELSLTAYPNAPVPNRETVICRGGRYDGRNFSSLIGHALLVVKDRLGPGHASDYLRTVETSGGMTVFDYVGQELPPRHP